MALELNSQAIPDLKYELNLNITGLATNCVFKAYQYVGGVKTYYEHLDKTILAIDISESGADEQAAAYGIMVALQSYIDAKNY
jgi:hypothetical protein